MALRFSVSTEGLGFSRTLESTPVLRFMGSGCSQETVRSAVELSFTDRRLQIVPDEVFLGDVAGEITATVNQACLAFTRTLGADPPEIKAGDKWLFFLRKLYLDAKPYDVVDFDSPAKPVSLAEYDICLLRLRSDIDESCIALMPARPRQTPLFCGLTGRAFRLTSPFPSRFPEHGIKFTLSAPPEFRVHDANGLNAAGATFQSRGWHSSCPPGDG